MRRRRTAGHRYEKWGPALPLGGTANHGRRNAGEAFWEPGGDVIHYQEGNNRTDIPLRFVATMLCAPGQPMLVIVDDEELKRSGWTRRSPA
jgi:hypothetical protein